jgi:hypothetical protein
MTGSEFIESVRQVSRAKREGMILEAFKNGNWPAFMQRGRAVVVSGPAAPGYIVAFFVTPDYLAVGTDQDYVRIPMSPLTAQKVADLFQCILPTRKMVNSIYQAADIKLEPKPLTPGAQMMSTEYYAKHNAIIEGQLKEKDFHLGNLVDGHKKNVIVSQTIQTHPNKVIIFGWHQLNGRPIQPLSWIHENTYADYSHGIRLVSKLLIVNGLLLGLTDALNDPTISKLLSDEGQITATRYS